MHMCELCGYYCDCDMEDTDNPQPEDCVHLGSCCDEEERYEEEDFEYGSQVRSKEEL